jgi:hypothetical protein
MPALRLPSASRSRCDGPGWTPRSTRCFGASWRTSQLIDDEKGDAAKSLLQTREGTGIASLGESADQVGGAVEGDVVTAFDGLDAERGGQMGLSRATGPDSTTLRAAGIHAQRPSSSTCARSRPWARLQSNWARIFWAGSRAAWRRLSMARSAREANSASSSERRCCSGGHASARAWRASGSQSWPTVGSFRTRVWARTAASDVGHAEALSRSAS